MISVEEIRRRILEKAKAEWPDHGGTDRDPLVELLVGACATELAFIYKEIDASEQRVIERLVDLLIPSYKDGPSPAYSLAFAHPKTFLSQLKAHEVKLVASSTRALTKQSTDIYLSPAGPITCIDAKVKVIAYRDKNSSKTDVESPLITIQPNDDDSLSRYIKLQNRLAERAIAPLDYKTNLLVLFLHIDEKVNSLEDVSLYFDLPVPDDQNIEQSSFLKELQRAQWLLNEKQIHVQCGLPETTLPMNEELNPVRLLERDIRNKYTNHFITFQKDALVKVPSHISLPGDLNSEQLRLKYLAELSTNPIILEIRFQKPVMISNDLFVSFNCFPVINRQLNVLDIWYRHEGVFPVQLNSEHAFLGLESVYDIADENDTFSYSQLTSFNKEKNINKCTLINKGLGRYDNFNYWQRYQALINNFRRDYKKKEIDTLLNEFSLEELQEIFESIPDANKNQIEKNGPYLLLQKKEKEKQLHVKILFWGTQGESVNNARVNSKLAFQEGVPLPELKKDEIFLLKPIKEGRNAPTSLRGLKTLKDILFQNDKIVSYADIEKFCFSKFREQIKRLSIHEGTALNPHNKTGIRRVIEVNIELSINYQEDQLSIFQSIEEKLNTHSRSIIPIIVKNFAS